MTVYLEFMIDNVNDFLTKKLGDLQKFFWIGLAKFSRREPL
jgi:hypothetical protein